MDISIVILARNKTKDVEDNLRSISKLTHTHLLKEVVLLDNGSDIPMPDMGDFLGEQSNKLIQLRSEKNLGAAGGRNYATNKSTGDIIVWLDDDSTVLDTSFLKDVETVFQSESLQLGIVAFNIFKANGEQDRNYFPHKKYDLYKNKKQFRTWIFASCGAAMRRSSWQRTIGFPEDFIVYQEENDLAFQTINAGYYILFDSRIKVLHKRSGKRSSSFEARLNWLNKSKVAYKYLPSKYFFSIPLMWSFKYLKDSNFNLKEWWKVWKQIFRISKKYKKSALNKNSFHYLKSVGARLWY